MSRVSPYKSEFCDQAIEHLGTGLSIMGLAGELGVCRATLYNWKETHQEFAEAIDIGLAKGAAAWEKRLIKIADAGGGNPTAAIFGLKNRAHEEWKDRQEHELTGKDGGAIQVTDPGSKELARQLLHLLTKPTV